MIHPDNTLLGHTDCFHSDHWEFEKLLPQLFSISSLIISLALSYFLILRGESRFVLYTPYLHPRINGFPKAQQRVFASLIISSSSTNQNGPRHREVMDQLIVEGITRQMEEVVRAVHIRIPALYLTLFPTHNRIQHLRIKAFHVQYWRTQIYFILKYYF